MLKGNRLLYLNKRGIKKKRIKKDYQYKSLINPFFRSKKKKNNNKTKKIYWPFLLFLLIFLSILYFLFFTSYFNIKNIEIRGTQRIENSFFTNLVNEQAQKNRFLFFPQKNLLVFNSSNLKDDLNKKFKLESINVYKNFPKTLILEIQERQVSFIWQNNDSEVFYSDNFACLIEENLLEEELAQDYPILKNETNNEYLNNDNCLSLDTSYIESMFELNSYFEEYEEIDLKYFVLGSERHSIIVSLSSGPKAIFNTKDDLLKQVARLIIVKQEQSRDDLLNLEYIDLRFGDLIYFK